MDYEEHFREQELWFDLNASEPELIDNAAFIRLILMKFDGAISHSSRCVGNAGTTYTFKVTFPSWGDCSNAKAHCDRNMDSNGNVTADYKGAIDAADPGRSMANKILKKVSHNI